MPTSRGYKRSRARIPRLELDVDVVGWWHPTARPDAEVDHELILPVGQTWPAAVARGQAVDVRLTGPTGARALIRGTVVERRLRRARIRGLVVVD